MGYLSSMLPPEPPPGTPGDPGLFGPDSAVWRIGRERALLAAGPAALLLQVAHPLVAAGVADHSDFSADPLRRLRGTLDATLSVVFGDTDQAAAAAARVAARHRPVVGRTQEPVGRFPTGTAYRAGDPDLARWVHATLVWTALELYDGFIAPLSREDRVRYHGEMARFGSMFGVPEELLSGGYERFEHYVRAMDADGVLRVGPQARRIAAEVLSAGAGELPPPLASGAGALATTLAAGLLPPRLQAEYELPWGRAQRAAYTAVRGATRTSLPALPSGVRYFPHYLAARRRVG